MKNDNESTWRAFVSLVMVSLAAGLAAASVTTASAHGQLAFTDVTDAAGAALPSTLNESVAWGDIDGDGDPDLYLTNNAPNVLLRNDGVDVDGLPVMTDISVAAGVDHAGFSVGAAFGDLDNDGDLDLYVVSFGSGPDVLYRNDTPQTRDGEPTRIGMSPGVTASFADITAAAGINDETSSRGVALVDYDHDGLLDIYVNAIGPDILYRNLGGLTFESVGAETGIVASNGQGVGVVATDIDDDGRIDLFTGNRSNDPNRLFRNLGGEAVDPISFDDITADAGIVEVGLGMGVCALDIDNDLDSDLYWTAWPGGDPTPQPNALYRNIGSALTGPIFEDITEESGTADPLGWGISCNAADIDNDGLEDLAITNGFDATSTANVLFHNQGPDGGGDVTFDDVTAALEGGGLFDGRGVAFADFDLDGDVDLALTGGPTDDTRLWRNDSVNGNGWLTVTLEGTVSNRSGIGARLWIETDLGTVMREVSGGAGRGSFNDPPVEVGLGGATTVRGVRVRWPSGLISEITDRMIDQRIDLDEDSVFENGFERGDTTAWTETLP